MALSALFVLLFVVVPAPLVDAAATAAALVPLTDGARLMPPR